MKKIIIFILVIAGAITINSCKKTMFYACCDIGHSHWESTKSEKESDAQYSGRDHDGLIHNNVSTAQICSEYK